ncbi:hypothetical protein [Paenibacillus sp. FSL H8-0034]|uniref:hypothetical protein n=1 Tax=Paenibacillus sp. FSL H8-0034 TaxID=2954671 RepID=UPI0030F4D87C
MSKQLTLTTVNKAHAKEFNEQKKVTLKTGDFLLIDVHFRKAKIQQLLIDYQELLEQTHTKAVSMGVLKDTTFVFYMLLLRHFTSLSQIPNEIDKLVVCCEKLLDLGILEEILNAFDEKELQKVTDTMKRASENSKSINSQLESE